MLGIEKDDYEVSGTLRIECKDGEDPLRDILDYDMKCTEEIFFHFPDGRDVRFIREDLSVKERLALIEKMTREAFGDAETDLLDGNYNKLRDCYRKAQVLANIFAIFEYDGKTFKEDM